MSMMTSPTTKAFHTGNEGSSDEAFGLNNVTLDSSQSGDDE